MVKNLSVIQETWVQFLGWEDLLEEGKADDEVKVIQLCWLFVIPWTMWYMEFSRPEYWSGQPFPSPGDLPNPGIESRPPTSQADSSPPEPQRTTPVFWPGEFHGKGSTAGYSPWGHKESDMIEGISLSLSIVLECCVGFCLSTMWISHNYIYYCWCCSVA